MRSDSPTLWLTAPALTALSLLAARSNDPRETATDNTAGVVPSQAAAADSSAVTVDSTRQ
ncbi:hypothetical protein [Hymenobacter psoromatis]|uniref:hypothetical protein n=1 Tax=Hymenobacter psoromatis TaxID=1484116 RepID=UPI001CC17DE2|nr:hypothetical protein [Hymenobacter psoromatis]